MGIADRDYMRRPSPPRRSSRPLVAALGALALFLVVFGRAPIDWVRAHLPHDDRAVAFGFGPIRGPSVPARHDPWKAFLAPQSVCPGRADAEAPERAQERAALCMLDYARARHGLPSLPESALLSHASALKAADIARCDDFSHEACGKDAIADATAAGVRARGWGENIYAGGANVDSPLAAVDGWLNSPHHRENLFRREWTTQGIALLRADRLEGHDHVAVWVSEFGA